MERGVASLELVVGPMTSGKTTELQRQYRRQSSLPTSKVLVIKPEADTRDPHSVRTHDGRSIPCVRLKNLCDIISYCQADFLDASVVLIDEAQFFSDVVEGCKLILRYNKPLFVYALDGDRFQRPFGNICNLLPLCKTVKKLLAVCRCGRDAPFTMSIDNMIGDEQLVPGGCEIYSPICESCLNSI